ncbi:Carboxylesterase [Fimicolochytrium jonesii]|uniref:Carboxylesterase n=1 Tax=Fimicolochytrium jonesii TaxID=1396493 RepID=UPI0022FE9D69|nr:Carboxylesterase [Fimicolochytrium jonesii]KAI8817317.1 Carboxylesterase [Fimicolochytrium jonesii]
MLVVPFLLAVATATSVSSAAPTPTTVTPAGTYTGKACPQSPTYAQYLGIPFAKPPTGDLRFAAPVAYDGPFKSNVTQMPPACYQNAFSGFPVPANQSEDCLFLNVYAPVIRPAKPLPVRFFIYGGGFQSGDVSSHYYDGCQAVRRAAPPTDSIVVTVNYRVGPQGFLAHPVFAAADGSVGNYGFLDQQLALKWVKANIRQFGGDPAKVVIFGESAGGNSVFAHMAAPSSAGLFSAAVSQSGLAVGMFPKDVAAEVAREFANNAGCTSGDVASCLRSLPPAAILNASMVSPSLGQPGYKFTDILKYGTPDYGLVQDAVTFPNVSRDAFLSGEFNKVPVLAGTNLKEANLFLPRHNFTEDDYKTYISDSFPANLTSAVSALYPLSAMSPAAAISQIATDRWMACPSRRDLKAIAAAGVPTYAYLYNVTLSCNFIPGVPSKLLGPSHYSEIPLVFDFTTFAGPCTATQAEQDLALAMGIAWTSMAERGRPFNDTAATWPQYPGYEDLSVAGPTAVTTEKQLDYWNPRCAIFDQIDWPYVITQTNYTTQSNGTGAASTPSGSSSGSNTNSASAPAGHIAPAMMVVVVLALAIL